MPETPRPPLRRRSWLVAGPPPARTRTKEEGLCRAIRGSLAPSARPLPIALPAGAPLDNVGIARSLVRLEQRSFDAPSPDRAPRGCPLRQCWDPRERPTPVTVLPTLSKTAPRTGARGRLALTTRCRQPAIRFDHRTPKALVAVPHGRRPLCREAGVTHVARGTLCGRATSDDSAARTLRPGCTAGSVTSSEVATAGSATRERRVDSTAPCRSHSLAPRVISLPQALGPWPQPPDFSRSLSRRRVPSGPTSRWPAITAAAIAPNELAAAIMNITTI